MKYREWGFKMTQVTPIHDLEGYLEPDQVERLIAAATNPRDKALVAVLAKTWSQPPKYVPFQYTGLICDHCTTAKALGH